MNQIPEKSKFFKGNQRAFFLVWVYMDRKAGLPSVRKNAETGKKKS